MPITPTYPGVYVQEVPSGVRTIVGVSTSVAAFVGTAKRGPINKAVHILNFSDYERRFGGLDADSEMSYAVRQFFINGGSDSWVVRLAKDAIAAFYDLQNNASSPVDVLKVTALDEGKSGNDIEIRVDYKADNPYSYFNLTFNYTSKDNPADDATETFTSLSMNSDDARYVEDMVNDVSRLVRVERVYTTLSTLPEGTSISGQLGDVKDLLGDTHKSLRISVNGSDPVDVELDVATILAESTPGDRIDELCTDIAAKVVAANPALAGFTCTANAAKDGIEMESFAGGEKSTVRVLPGFTNDASVRLKLGTANGGIETDGVAGIRPAEIPLHGSLTSGGLQNGDITGGTPYPGPDDHKFMISIDGLGPDTVDIGPATAAGSNFSERMADIAGRIETEIRELKPSFTGYSNFTCTVSGSGVTQKLVLSSGSNGTGSSVEVTAVSSDDLALGLKLLLSAGAVAVKPNDVTLAGGSESPFSTAEAYKIYIGSRSARKGIYALESVDLFNLLCLPGISDSGILMDSDSYCKERRSFLIADAPYDKKTPADMVATISGTALPKSDHGAVYYPWLQIADPLKNGKSRMFAPCGSIAGLYARTDSARGVWKAPAGTDANLTGVQGAEYILTDRENGTLNPLGVNCVRVFPVYGALAWGARTLRGADQMTSEYKYIPVRRMALFLEESLYRGLKWVVFEPNDEPLWSQIRLNVGAFMHRLFRQGAFQGTTPKDAYLVKCDSETTTQTDINLGIVNIVVGFAPLKPAEFVIIKIKQLAGQIET